MIKIIFNIIKYLSIILYGIVSYALIDLIQAGIDVLFDNGKLYAPLFPVTSFEKGLEDLNFLLTIIGTIIYFLLLLFEMWRQYSADRFRWFVAWKIMLAGMLLFLAFFMHMGTINVTMGLLLLLIFYWLCWRIAILS